MTTINAIQGKSLYTELEVGGSVTRFLVDSGAEISILPEGHALLSKNCVLKGARMRPVLVDGSELPVKGVVLGSVRINDTPINVEFYVVQANISPILGNDIMRGFSWVTLDFENQAVKLGPQLSEHSLGSSDTSNPPKVCRLILPNDLEVPGHHEVIVPGLVDCSGPSELGELSEKDCLFESTLENSSISAARVLGRVHNGVFPVRICNPFSKSIQLQRNKNLGTLSVVEEPAVVAVVGENEDFTDLMASQPEGSTKLDVLDPLVQEAEVSKNEQQVFREFLYTNKEVFSLHGELGRFRSMPMATSTDGKRATHPAFIQLSALIRPFIRISKNALAQIKYSIITT